MHTEVLENKNAVAELCKAEVKLEVIFEVESDVRVEVVVEEQKRSSQPDFGCGSVG